MGKLFIEVILLLVGYFLVSFMFPVADSLNKWTLVFILSCWSSIMVIEIRVTEIKIELEELKKRIK